MKFKMNNPNIQFAKSPLADSLCQKIRHNNHQTNLIHNSQYNNNDFENSYDLCNYNNNDNNIISNSSSSTSSNCNNDNSKLINVNSKCSNDNTTTNNNNNNTNNNIKYNNLCQNCSCYHCCCYSTTNQTTESGFYKFLTRFSGRRRSLQQIFNRLTSSLLCVLITLSLFSVTEACSARTTPKPRPPPTPTPRPNITFHTYNCPATYAEWYCLNDAKCFSVKIADEILYNCWCADGYMGPRCEFKEIDGSFLPTRPRVMMETASIASGATLALIIVLIICLIFYIRWQQRQKEMKFNDENGGGGGGPNGFDTVDGIIPATMNKSDYYNRRPFGPHHNTLISMEDAFRKHKTNDV